MACGTGNEAAPPTAPPAVLPPVSSDPRTLGARFPVSRRLLFDRIGMSGSSWIPHSDTGELGWILSSTARDMARFGLLALNRGRWNGVPILADSAWFASSWRATPPDNAGYGLLWWLNGSTNYRTPGPYLLPSPSRPSTSNGGAD
jgi:CubicO group peptidase (beta-lactamase class C family)